MEQYKLNDLDRQFVRERVETSRWKHIQRVVELSEQLNSHYSKLNGPSLRSAALFHDAAKCLASDKQKHLAREFEPDWTTFMEHIPALWHGPASAQLIIDELDYSPSDDRELLEAVAYHPTGQAPLTPTLRGLLVADFCEPGRTFKQAQTLRNQIGNLPLDTLCQGVIQSKIKHCLSQPSLLHPRSIDCWNELCQ